VYQAEWAREQRLASALVTRRVQLSNIVDHKRQLLDSHVILGFSRCGQLLLSYLSELDVTATQSNYTLHWWRFLGNCPLRHVMKEPLFRGEPVPAELHLVVCQTPPPMHTVVVGCRGSCAEDLRQACYVSVLAFSPLCTTSSSHHYSLHFKFDLMPPFPSFIPSLSLGVPSMSHIIIDYSPLPLRPVYDCACYCRLCDSEYWGQCHSSALLFPVCCWSVC
jgi:hypothetical protein